MTLRENSSSAMTSFLSPGEACSGGWMPWSSGPCSMPSVTAMRRAGLNVCRKVDERLLPGGTDDEVGCAALAFLAAKLGTGTQRIPCSPP